MKKFLISFIFIFLYSIIYSQTNPIARWGFNGTGEDKMGNYPLTGELHYGSSLPAAERSNCLSLDNPNAPINCGEINLGDKFTISGWYYLFGSGTPHIRTIFSSISGDHDIEMFAQIDLLSGRVEFGMASDGITTVAESYANIHTSNRWIHFVFIVDILQGSCEIYIDGENQTEEGEIALTSMSNTNWYLGGRANRSLKMWGYLDDFSLYSQLLNKDDVRFLFEGIPSDLNSRIDDMSPLTVVGNRIKNNKNQTVLLKGLSLPDQGDDWINENGQVVQLANRYGYIYEDFEEMSKWGINVVRAPVHQGPTDLYTFLGDNKEYYFNTFLDKIIDLADYFDMYVVIDYHDYCQDQTDDIIEFWQMVSERYSERTNVLYEILNEPSQDLSNNICGASYSPSQAWNVLKNTAEQAIQIIRANDEDAIVIVNGLTYGYDLSFVGSSPIYDPSHNLVYGTHPYPGKTGCTHNSSCEQGELEMSWDAKFGYVADSYPVIITEFGWIDDNTRKEWDASSEDYWYPLQEYINNRGIGYLAFAFVSSYDTDLYFPDDGHYQPTEMGAEILQDLQNTNNIPIEIDAPSSLETAYYNQGSVIISFQNNAPEAEGYILERKFNDADFVVLSALNSNELSFSDSDISEGNKYTYRVRAFAEGIFSDYSEDCTINLEKQEDSSLFARWLFESNFEDEYANFNGSGNITYSTDSKEGNYSAYFDSRHDYISFGQIELGDRFIISGYYKVWGNFLTRTLFSNTNASDRDGIMAKLDGTTGTFSLITLRDSSEKIAKSEPGCHISGEWNHFEFVIDKRSGKCLIFINGEDRTLDSSITTDFKTNGILELGREQEGGELLWGYLDDVRISNIEDSIIFQNELFINTTGQGSVDPESGIFNYGEEVYVSATPDEGYAFAGWSGYIESNDNPLIINMTEDIVLTANFSETTTDTRLIKVNFGTSELQSPLSWNELLLDVNGNAEVSNLNDDLGENTGYGIKLIQPWQSSYPYGASPGIYPENVMKSYFRFCDGTEHVIELNNLAVNKPYTLSLFSSTWTYESIVEITVNNEVRPLNAHNNTDQTAVFANILPNDNGKILIKCKRMQSSIAMCTYLNALIIEENASFKKSEQERNIRNSIIEVYPNPVTSILTLENLPNRCIVRLFSLKNEVIKEVMLNCENSYLLKLDETSTGLYNLQIIDEHTGNIFNQMIVKE